MGSVALVFAGGDPPPPHALRSLPRADLVIAADSGLDHATALGFAVDLIVGDLDSADPATIDTAVAAGAAVEHHPEAKDATDLELALLAACRRGYTAIIVVGGHGGRLDHFLANTLLLASSEFAGVRLEARLGDAQVFVVRGEHELHGEAGRPVLPAPRRRSRTSACAPRACGIRCAERRWSRGQPVE